MQPVFVNTDQYSPRFCVNYALPLCNDPMMLIYVPVADVLIVGHNKYHAMLER